MSSFFFSSRRRHTRLTCDWSSDVCSSDLRLPGCSEDSHCGAGEICDNNLCIITTDCTTDEECSLPQLCNTINNICVTPECVTNEDCEANQQCNDDHTC